MVEACERTKGELGDRLLAALRAAVAGGGAGPVHAAGLLIAEREPWPLVDLRVDWTEGDPVAELDHLWQLWRPQMRDYLDRALDPARSAVEPGPTGCPARARRLERRMTDARRPRFSPASISAWRSAAGPGLMLDRTGIALVGAIVLVLAGAVAGEEVRAAIDVPTLVILFGLMVLSAQFAACGFYDWCSRGSPARPAGPGRPAGADRGAAGLLSAVLANDVVVFAMTPMLALGLLRRGLDPRPFLIALTAAANAGSAATIIGNPQNILIGQFGGARFLHVSRGLRPAGRCAALAITYGVVLAGLARPLQRRDPRVAHGPASMARRSTGRGWSRAWPRPSVCWPCSPRRCRMSRASCWSPAPC